MKKLTALILTVCLCLSLAACGGSGTGNPDHDYILHLLEQGDYDMAIRVIEGLRDKNPNAPQQSQQTQSSNERIFELVPPSNGSDWCFEMELVNDTDRHLTLEAVHITDYLDGQSGPLSSFEGADLDILPLGRLELEPGGAARWDNMRPLDYGFDRREYLHVFRDEQGEEFRIIYVFDMGGSAPAASAEPAGSDRTLDLAPETNGSDWIFHMDLINESDEALTLEALLIIDALDEQELGTSAFEGEYLNDLPLGQLVLQPGQGVGFDDGHPVTADFNRRTYLYVFVNGQGEQVRWRYQFDMRGAAPVDAGSPQQPAGDWFFTMTLENTGDSPWELTAMDITNLMGEQNVGTHIREGDDLDQIMELRDLVLQPGEQVTYNDGHPAVTDWNAREYRFHFKDSKGETHTLNFLFEDLDKQNQPVDYSADQGKDLKTLRHDADFEIEVSSGVYWVPASSLGTSRYTNADIYKLLTAAPEEKQRQIATLYEALQLYQVGNFTGSDDNVRIMENNIFWEHHKPGYHAVRTNSGCCATDSNWLRYILDSDYAEVGYIATSQRDGSGHIFNYILHNGWYYIIDLTHYHASGSPFMTAVEDGDLNSYRNTDYILGNIHKVKDIKDFVDYVQKDFGDPPGLMFMYTAENCLAVDGNDRQIIYESAGQSFVTVIFDDPSDNLNFVWKESPRQFPEWEQLPGYSFPG